jgi:phage shock protein B
MQGAFITAIVFGGIVISLAVIGTTILLGIRLIKGGVSRKHRQQDTDDTRTIQIMYRELSRIEERVGALETILMDRGKGADHEETFRKTPA